MAGDTFDGIATARQGGCWDTTFVDRGGIAMAGGGWDTPTGGCDKIEP